MSNKKAVNLTLHLKVLKMADGIMEARGQDNLTAFVEELIRVEYEKRFGFNAGAGVKAECAQKKARKRSNPNGDPTAIVA